MTTAITELENGDLCFSISDYSFSEFREWVEMMKKYYDPFQDDSTFHHDLEGKFYFVPDNVYSELGALTSAPLISDYDFWNEEDELKKEFMIEMYGLKVWWYPDYMVTNPFEVLLREGKVVFTLAEDVMEDKPKKKKTVIIQAVPGCATLPSDGELEYQYVKGKLINLGRPFEFVVAEVEKWWHIFEKGTGIRVCESCATRKEVIATAKQSISRFSDKQIQTSISQWNIVNQTQL